MNCNRRSSIEGITVVGPSGSDGVEQSYKVHCVKDTGREEEEEE